MLAFYTRVYQDCSWSSILLRHQGISGGKQKGKRDINILTAQKCQIFTSDFIEGEEIRLKNSSFGIILQMKYMIFVVLFLIYLFYQVICYFITAEPALHFSIPREGLKKVSFLYLLTFFIALMGLKHIFDCSLYVKLPEIGQLNQILSEWN